MSKIDNLARPIHPEASYHKPLLSPIYCLRHGPDGYVYLVPYIYDYGWEQLVKVHDEDTRKANMRRARGGRGTLCIIKFIAPVYAKRIGLDQLVFEKPQEVPCPR